MRKAEQNFTHGGIILSIDEFPVDESYENRMRKMRELEEQLAREKALLQEMESSKQAIPESNPGNDDQTDMSQGTIGRSFLDQTDFDDLNVRDNGYSENLLLPDEDTPLPNTTDIEDLTSSAPTSIIQDPIQVPIKNPSRDTFQDPISNSIRDPSIDDPIEDRDDPLTDDVQSNTEQLDEPLSEESFNGPPDIDSEINGYRNDIEEFRSRGYNVSRMYDLFSRDIDTIRQSVLVYMQDVNQLKEIEKKLDDEDIFNTDGFDTDVETLRSLLKNPDMVDEAESFFRNLTERIQTREVTERKSKIRDVEDLFDSVMKEFSDVTNAFTDKVEDIKVSIIDMETAPVSHYRSVKKMIFELKDSMIHEKLATERSEEKSVMVEDLKEWGKKGFHVVEIESLIETDLKAAREMMNVFIHKANKLLEFENEINSIMIKGFEKEISEIRKILRDTEKLFLVQNKVESLNRRIRLQGIQKKMDRLKKPASAARKGPTQMECPKCGGVVPIPSDERPLKVNCSSCSTEFHLKRIPSTEKTNAPDISHQPGTPVPPTQTPQGPPPTEVKPIQEPMVVTPLPAEPLPKENLCPKCGAPLLPDSVFCGLCGYKMDS